MSVGQPGTGDWAERWDHLFETLTAEPRRQILIALADATQERWLPLPDAATSPNQSMDAETLSIQLRHRHLPKLDDVGYVRWEHEPFRVRRGPNFEEAAFVVTTLLESADNIPQSLLDNCRVLPEIASDEQH